VPLVPFPPYLFAVGFASCQRARINSVKLFMKFQSSGDAEFLGLWMYIRLCLSVFWGCGVCWATWVAVSYLYIKYVGSADTQVSAFLRLGVGC